MAVKPKTGDDTFLREVDEELRRERVGTFMTRYGWYIVGAAALLLAAIGGWIWWQHRQTVQAGEASPASTFCRCCHQIQPPIAASSNAAPPSMYQT